MRWFRSDPLNRYTNDYYLQPVMNILAFPLHLVNFRPQILFLFRVNIDYISGTPLQALSQLICEFYLTYDEDDDNTASVSLLLSLKSFQFSIFTPISPHLVPYSIQSDILPGPNRNNHHFVLLYVHILLVLTMPLTFINNSATFFLSIFSRQCNSTRL